MTSGGNGHSEPEHGSPASSMSFYSGSGPTCPNGPGSAPGTVGTNREEIP